MNDITYFNDPDFLTQICQMYPEWLVEHQKKDIERNIHELIHIIDKPRFFCKTCTRAAHNKGFLCKPVKLQA